MKMETHQASNKRFKLTSRGKYMKRANGQGHFNGREEGNAGTNKRRDFAIADTQTKILNALNPYHL